MAEEKDLCYFEWHGTKYKITDPDLLSGISTIILNYCEAHKAEIQAQIASTDISSKADAEDLDALADRVSTINKKVKEMDEEGDQVKLAATTFMGLVNGLAPVTIDIDDDGNIIASGQILRYGVESVNGKIGDVSLTASDVSAVSSINGKSGTVTITADELGAVTSVNERTGDVTLTKENVKCIWSVNGKQWNENNTGDVIITADELGAYPAKSAASLEAICDDAAEKSRYSYVAVGEMQDRLEAVSSQIALLEEKTEVLTDKTQVVCLPAYLANSNTLSIMIPGFGNLWYTDFALTDIKELTINQGSETATGLNIMENGVEASGYGCGLSASSIGMSIVIRSNNAFNSRMSAGFCEVEAKIGITMNRKPVLVV